MRGRALSPILATLILVAIVVSAGLIYYMQTSGMFSRLFSRIEVQIVSVNLYKFEDKALLMASVKNTGSKPLETVIIYGIDDDGEYFSFFLPPAQDGLQHGLLTICREWGVASLGETGFYADDLAEFRCSFFHEKILGIKILSNVDTVGNPVVSGRGDKYSLQYIGLIYIPVDGTYEFAVDGDDAVAVLIDDREVATWYGPHGFSWGWSHRGSITLDRGYHKFEALMQEWGGGDGIKVAWKKPHDKGFSIIPGDYFYYGEIHPGETTNSTFLISSSIYSFTSGVSYPIAVSAYSLDGDVYAKTIFTVCS